MQSTAPFKPAQLAKPESALQLAYKNATDYKTVLAMIAGLPGDPEALRIKAQILESCTQVANAMTEAESEESKRMDEAYKRYGEKISKENAKRDFRAEFIESLNPLNPHYHDRIAAYDRLNTKRQEQREWGKACESLKENKTTAKELTEMWRTAELAGDPIAQVRDLHCGLESRYTGGEEKDPEKMIASMEDNKRRRTIEPARIDKVRLLVSKATPETIPHLLTILTSSYPNGFFTIENGGGASSESRIDKRLARLLPCDLGKNCSEDWSKQIDRACATTGQCAAGNIEDFLRFYTLSPMQAQDLEHQRLALLKMAQTGDASALKFTNRSRTVPETEFDPTEFEYLTSSFSCHK